MRLNKVTTHAIRILVACAHSHDRLIKVAELAEKLDLTAQNAFKVVHLLSRSGLLEAARGRYGGVKLAKPATAIPIGDVVRAMEAVSVNSDEAGLGEGRSDEQRFALFDEAFEAFLSVLDRTSVADMARADLSKDGSRRLSRRQVTGRGKKRTKVVKSAKVANGRYSRRDMPAM